MATAHSTSYRTFNKLLHIQQAYRTFHKPTAHSTSYYTLDKLPHIRQASTHSTSHRTHTLKNIPPSSVYTQVRSCRHRCLESSGRHRSEKNRGCIPKQSDRQNSVGWLPHIPQATAHSTSYYTFNKPTAHSTSLPHIQQATTH